MSSQKEPSKLQRLLNGNADNPLKRLPRRVGSSASIDRLSRQADSDSASFASEADSKPRYRWLPAFWTIASAVSLLVNIVLLGVALVALQQLGAIQLTANDQFSGLLGGLYENFVKMDEAHIRTTIPIRQEIPVQFTLNVTGATDVVLTRDVTINNALVTVQTGGLNIVNAVATIVLPQGTALPVNIQSLTVPVDQRVPIAFDVGVDIPLNQTDLHIPFLGLRQVVEPWYCLVEPNAVVNGVQVCSPLANPIPTEQITP
jgi:hypothetical protein